MTTQTRTPGRAATRRAGRPRRPPGTRAALLAAATELFAAHGFDGVSVSDIAEKAGVNRAMISYHFGGKRDLYATILAATFQEIVADVERIAGSAGPAPQVLRAIVAAIGDAATHRHPHFCTMMLREVLTGGQHMQTAVLAQPARVLAAVQRVVERGVREGAFRPVDPLLTHLSLVGSLVFFFATTGFRQRVIPDRRSPDGATYVKHLQDLIIEGLATRDAGPKGAARP
ncbi:MAG TPA: TetR family transcriptional regulator [Verrucomicrobiae bacterium]|jgi:TetR/AcrR family transcriptional regulator|nr:TetR family transcriptional regulator [Verrucomicrobiae bacterium]